LNTLLELSPLEVFVKCYKLRATKCTFVKHSSRIISLVSLCKIKISKGDNDRRMFNKGIFCSPEFVTFYIKKKIPGEIITEEYYFLLELSPH
jgi:hypothetical protein